MNRRGVIIHGTVDSLVLAVIAICICTSVTALNLNGHSDSCNRDVAAQDKIVNLLASKTPYIFKAPATSSNGQLFNETCEVVHLWLVVRHGSKYPENDFMTKSKEVPHIRDKIVNAHTLGKGQLCEEDVAAFKEWTPSNISESDENTIAPQGILELEELGRRFCQRYPTVFSKKSPDSSLIFRYTDTLRAEASARAFVRGCLGTEEASKVTLPKPPYPDPVLRSYKTCQKYINEINDNPESLKEQSKFKKSQNFEGLLRRLEKRTGLSSEDVTAKTAILLYEMCSYETAWSGGKRISTWCSIFSEEDLRLLEYNEDLDYYWRDGYGNDLNSKITCPTLQDLMENLINKTLDLEVQPSSVAYFSHSGLLLKFGALLGLFKDPEPLRHDNYEDNRDRKWRSSYINKDASNLAFILHKCDEKNFKVQLLHQEVALAIPRCTDGQKEGNFCPIEEFSAIYSPLSNNCNLEQLCEL